MHEDFARVEQELAERGPGRMVPDLTRIEALLDLLGSPQRAYPSIHITGTNGKTSTSRMIDSLLRAHGLRGGRYTSPHLETVRERISIEGEPITEEKFAVIYDEVAPLADFLDGKALAAAELDDQVDRVTYFELTTALAFAAFADAPVDVATVEVGLGGAWDATNVLHAGVCIITPIGLDHTELLGDTVEEIATEKAGIIHSGARVICALQDPTAMRPIQDRCDEVGGKALVEGIDFGVTERAVAVGGQVLTIQGLGGTYDEIFIPLHGAHQAQNAAVALAAVEAFLGQTDRPLLDIEVVREGFAMASSPGRLERVRSAPDDPAGRRPQSARHGRDGHRAGGGVQLPQAGRRRRGAGRQGRRGRARGAGAGAQRHRHHPEHVAARDGTRAARGAGHRDLRRGSGARGRRRCRTRSRPR